MHKITLIRGGNVLTSGHHYFQGWRKLSYNQPAIKVRHYCWNDVTDYNRNNRRNAMHPVYKKIQALVKELQ